MSIQEQIKIARLIASGTPREVAILESSSAIEPSGPTVDVDAEEVKDTPQQKSKKRSEIAKAKQDALAKKRKEVMDRKKVERLRRSANKIRNTAASAITGAKYSKANIQQVSKDEGGATATQKAVGNVAKTGVAATKNVAKGLAKAVVGIRDLNRARKDRARKNKAGKKFKIKNNCGLEDWEETKRDSFLEEYFRKYRKYYRNFCLFETSRLYS